MAPLTAAFIALICLLGATVQASCGFGFAMVVMGVLASLMASLGEAAGLSNLLMLCVSAVFMLRLRGRICWKGVLWPLVGHLPVSFFMVRLVAADANGVLRTVLGCVLIALAVYLFAFQGRLHIRMTPLSSILTGVASGALGGLFCMGGVPMALYLISMEEKEDYLATIQTFFTIVAAYSVILHLSSGFITASVLKTFPFALIAVAAGAWIGKKIFDRVDRETLKRLVYLFMCASGILLIVT